MTRYRALCFGEALIDEFPDRRVVAGAPLHVAAHLAALGWEANLVTRIGDDEDGRSITAALATSGVGLDHVETDPELPTGTTTITLTESGHGFTVNRPAAWDAILGPQTTPDVDVVYFGTLAMRDGRSRSALDRILGRSSARRVVDLNLRAPDYDAATVTRAVAEADILKLSDGEWPQVARLLEIGPSPEALLTLGPEWVCLTKGAAGAGLLRRGGGAWSAAAPETGVVDTVGAGDAFCAGLIDGLVGGGDPDRALVLASAAAASTLGGRGGLPPPTP
ncbi:MAG: PfkB family carbohydrate kinase [Acidimicrobiia bacterium]